MRRNFFTPAALAILLVSSQLALADTDQVREGVETFVGAAAVDSVEKTEYGQLYEVVLRSGELVYTDEAVSFIIDGRIIDTQTRRDVTAARKTELASIDFDELPLDNAIKLVRGDGSRVFATFEDPNCGYCKRLASEIAGMDDVTVHTFLYPVLGEDSERKSRNIWCADDPAQAWQDWILDAQEPEQASCDTQAIEDNVELGRELRVQGTPTLFFQNGQRIGGFVPADRIEQALQE